jgi:hypothetical protein
VVIVHDKVKGVEAGRSPLLEPSRVEGEKGATGVSTHVTTTSHIPERDVPAVVEDGVILGSVAKREVPGERRGLGLLVARSDSLRETSIRHCGQLSARRLLLPRTNYNSIKLIITAGTCKPRGAQELRKRKGSRSP